MPPGENMTISESESIEIVAWRLPGCVLSHKSAYLLRPTEFGNLFITYRFTKKITDLPGITLNVMEGPEHIDTDNRHFLLVFLVGKALCA